MGTSTANGGTSGSGTPLEPSWLGNDGNSNDQQIPEGNTPSTPQQPISQAADPRRYTAPRNAFSRFARSGGASRSSLGSAVSGYVSRTSGGAQGAARRMGASRGTGERLLGFLNDAANRGINEALRSLDLSDLAGRSAGEIFKGLADYICPEGGNIDVAIARDAFYQTIVDLEAEGITDLNNMNGNQMQTIFEMFATHAIEDRIYNEIGTKAITLPTDIAAINNVQTQLHDFIGNGVTDALNGMKDRLRNLPQDKILEFVDDVYEQAFNVLQVMGEAEKDTE